VAGTLIVSAYRILCHSFCVAVTGDHATPENYWGVLLATL